MTALYFGGILMGLLMALLLRGTMFRGEAVPFVMELPNYRLPGAKNVCQLLWDKAKDFLQRAFTVIFLATLIIWFLQTFDLRFAIVSDSSQSILAMIGRRDRTGFPPDGLRRLAHFDRAHLRLYGQGERRFYADRTVRLDF